MRAHPVHFPQADEPVSYQAELRKAKRRAANPYGPDARALTQFEQDLATRIGRSHPDCSTNALRTGTKLDGECAVRAFWPVVDAITWGLHLQDKTFPMVKFIEAITHASH